ncbi:MAG: tRNA uridine-5-carboxymethylaminomethyl(34) synthesis GTPase MnmE [Thermodesulfobacteriota bacterium]|nr:tRNA uridine-5-carboxymethylaminomethyl(34) synthesis GTPase MnmE [Thermodesulfobacteriota bacterium]
MSKGTLGDTIAAISTPLGMGGIGIVRISGPQAQPIAKNIFRRRGQEVGSLLSRRFYFGEIIRPEDQTVIDEVLLVFMGQPKTYTREDVVEIQCHSGVLVLKEILQVVLRWGSRLAEPGEFTKRAFLNGRIDLTQAEAVIDLINAKTQQSLKLANRQLAGKLATEVRQMKDGVLDLLTLLEAGVDFPEEEIPEISPAVISRQIKTLLDRLNAILQTYQEGRIYREGIAAVIVGKPNVGKSSLLNSLLGEERAIVTAIPGTTRDSIEETINIQGIPLRILDTAGLRHARDLIEEEGVKRTKKHLSQADLVIWVLDGSEPANSEDLAILPEVQSKKTIIAVNKKDLPQRIALESLRAQLPEAPFIPISALYGSGIDHLKETIRNLVLDGKLEPAAEIIISNLRHKQAIESARDSLSQAWQSLKANLSYEFIILDLKTALEALGEIIGEVTPEDVLDRIFEQFCIGK